MVAAGDRITPQRLTEGPGTALMIEDVADRLLVVCSWPGAEVDAADGRGVLA